MNSGSVVHLLIQEHLYNIQIRYEKLMVKTTTRSHLYVDIELLRACRREKEQIPVTHLLTRYAHAECCQAAVKNLALSSVLST
jgi:homoserine trans-succinylase